MSPDSVIYIRTHLEDIQEHLMAVRKDLEKLTIYTGKATQNILEAEIYVEAALDEVFLILKE